MKILFFDTETSGLPKMIKNQFPSFQNVEYYDSSRLVSLSWIICDENEETIKQRDLIVKPDNFEIPDYVVKIHNISNEKAHNEGKKINFVLDEFYKDLKEVDKIVAHNMDFDYNIIMSECFRYNIFSLMLHMEKICKECTLKIASVKFKRRLKLKVLYELLTNDVSDGNYHNSLFDTEICMKCYFSLKKS
jgi:DNA polymerase III epsilon subunit-like protein